MPFILFLGRFARVKGIDILLNSIKIIKDTNFSKQIKFVIMGVDFGFQEQMFDMIKKFNLEDIVCVIKNPNRDDVIAAYRETEFLVLPSRWELSPLTPLEGFVFKKSVISTNVHGIPSTITNGKNCVLVENEDFQNLAIQIMKLFDNFLILGVRDSTSLFLASSSTTAFICSISSKASSSRFDI